MAGVVADARAIADAAAARAAVEVRPLMTLDEVRQAESLLSEVWGRPAGSPTIETDMLRAFALSGNYVAGAWGAHGLVGAAAGIHGRDGEGLHLHSVITGVRHRDQVRNVGFALKQHQRAWALERDLDRIVWTFDPLVRRNARFNLTKLGAEVVGYHENLYGAMDDAFNRGDESDRCLVVWRLTGARALDAASGAAEPQEPQGATRVLTADADGAPRCAPPDEGATLLAWVPEDIVAVRTRDPSAARAWRLAVRESVGAALTRGYVATAMLRSGSYVLERRP
jgi:predicted GNAT superfamily acetyltransferase